MNNKLITIGNVRGYVENEVAYLNLEDVANGLGFTQVKSGVTYVRWETLRDHLYSFGFSQEVGKDTFIPENIFYRLAMKAKNSVAESFQAKVADEILPSIRKTGSYGIPQTYAAALQLAADQALMIEQQKLELLEQKPKVEFFDAVAESKDAIEIASVAKVLNVPGVGRNKLFEFLRNHKILMRNNQPYQKYVDCGYFRIIEQKYERPNGDTCINIKTLVYQKGVKYIQELLKSAHM